MKFIKEEATKANTHVVNVFDRTKYWYCVVESMDHNEGMSRGHYRVKLDRDWCDCGKFQVFRMLCSHVMAACSKVRQDYPTYYPMFTDS